MVQSADPVVAQRESFQDKWPLLPQEKHTGYPPAHASAFSRSLSAWKMALPTPLLLCLPQVLTSTYTFLTSLTTFHPVFPGPFKSHVSSRQSPAPFCSRGFLCMMLRTMHKKPLEHLW